MGLHFCILEEGRNVSHEGMSILLDKEAKRSLIEWQLFSAGIAVAGFKTNIRNIVMIQCYAPTEVAEDVKRQEFYVQLSATPKKRKKKDIYHSGRRSKCKGGPGQ